MAQGQDAYEIYYRRGRFKSFLLVLLSALLFAIIYKIATDGGLIGIEFKGRASRTIRNHGIPISGAVLAFAILNWFNNLVRRQITIYGDPSCFTLLAGRREIGPFEWSEVREFSVLNYRGSKAVHIVFHNPERSLKPFKRGLNKYRTWVIGTPHLLFWSHLVDVTTKRAARELESMRRMYS